MGSVSVVTTVKWFWFLLSLAALAGVIVALARSFKEASIQRYPEVGAVMMQASKWLRCRDLVQSCTTGH